MRVLMSAYACLPGAGSEPGIGWNWATQMAARGLEVVVLTTEGNRERIETELALHPRPHLNFHYVSLSTRRLHEGTGPHYALWQWKALREARQLVDQQPFDLVHHVSYGSLHVPTQLWRLGVPTIFGPVGGAQTTPRSMLGYFGRQQRTERLRTLFTAVVRRSPWHRRWLRKMAAVLVANTDTQAMVRAMGRPDAELMFDTGVAAEALLPGPRAFGEQSGPLRILWVGRMMPRKALSLSMDILARVTAPATMTILGDGLPAEEVWQMATERGVRDKILWSGQRLPWDEVQKAYRTHDVMLFNSLRETGGSQLIEAMTLGLPIVTLQLHGPGDLVPADAGLKVEVHTPEQVVREMAAALDRYAAAPGEERSAMSRAAWRFAQQLTHEDRASRAEALYRRVLHLPPATTAEGAKSTVS